jgi:(p)ppGpp synthase/HD superfamily hydrolase
MNLTKAILIATGKHDGQYDKGGNPYILHPLRLMLKAENDTDRIVAVLHDVIEDTDYTIRDLLADGFEQEIIDALDCLTKRKGETYDEFIQRIKPNALAKAVKLLDLKDNMDITRIENPDQKDYDRLKKYEKAIQDLT